MKEQRGINFSSSIRKEIKRLCVCVSLHHQVKDFRYIPHISHLVSSADAAEHDAAAENRFLRLIERGVNAGEY